MTLLGQQVLVFSEATLEREWKLRLLIIRPLDAKLGALCTLS